MSYAHCWEWEQRISLGEEVKLLQRVIARLALFFTFFTFDMHSDKLLATISPLLKKMISSFIWYSNLKLSFCCWEFFFWKLFIWLWHAESSLINSGKKPVFYCGIILIPAEPESLDLFINSSPISNCLQNLVPWLNLLVYLFGFQP